jgi:hypothetical protein
VTVMTAGEPKGLARTGVPDRSWRAGAGRGPRAGMSPASIPRASGSCAGVSRTGVSRTGVSRAPVTRAGVSRAGITGIGARAGGAGAVVLGGGVPGGGAARAGGLRPAGSWRAQPPGPVRLTRRGRVVVAGLLTAAVLMAVVLLGLAAAAKAQAAGGGSPAGSAYRNLASVVVHPGQTLWSIASRAQPSADLRIVVQQIIELNALTGTGIEPGERLWVPRG